MIIGSNKSGGTTPTGTINITQNGQTDVTDYAMADVAVSDTNFLNATSDFNDGYSLIDEDLTTVVKYAFYQRKNIIKVIFPKVTTIGSNAFDMDSSTETKLTAVYLKSLTSPVYGRCFRGHKNLTLVDIGSVLSLQSQSFVYCSRLQYIIIRKINELCSLAALDALTYTYFRNGTGGTAYVPYWIIVSGETVSGVTAYSTATNWSALESATFASIQENLVTLFSLGVDITDYYEIVSVKPTTDIDDTIVYFIETATSGTYEQWFHGSGSWEQLPNITLSEGE